MLAAAEKSSEDHLYHLCSSTQGENSSSCSLTRTCSTPSSTRGLGPRASAHVYHAAEASWLQTLANPTNFVSQSTMKAPQHCSRRSLQLRRNARNLGLTLTEVMKRVNKLLCPARIRKCY